MLEYTLQSYPAQDESEPFLAVEAVGGQASPAEHFSRVSGTKMKRIGLVLLGADAALIDLGGAAKIFINPASAVTSPLKSEAEEYLGELSAILITNFGAGHSDISRLPESVSRKAPVILPEGCQAEAKEAGFDNIMELGWGQSIFERGVKITAAPAAPADGRFSAIIEAGGLTVFFAGRTLFEPLVAKIARQLGKLDLALLPVGGPTAAPAPGKKSMMSAQEAAGMCTILSPGAAVPILFEEDPTAPAAFKVAARIFSPSTKIETLKPGELFIL